MGCGQAYPVSHKTSIIIKRSSNVDNYNRSKGPSSHSASVLYPNGGNPRPSNSSGVIMLGATLLIQRWYRRYLARLEVQRRATWSIFQSLEYTGEQDQLRLYNFFNDMLTHMEIHSDDPSKATMLAALKKTSSRDRPDQEIELLCYTDPSEVIVPSSYTGPRLKMPVTSNQLESLIEAFKNKKQLHAKYVLELLHETRKVLKGLPNVVHVNTDIAQEVTVCGDLHGSLDDLFVILHKNGLPSPDNPYIFNGDFVDRGNFSVEIACVLFLCMLLHPNEVTVNRGNHEDHVMNLRYGFIKEVMRKYKSHASKVLRLFQDVFSWLPLATVINDKVLVCHGGISDRTDLYLVNEIDRHSYESVLQPPIFLSGADELDIQEWKQVLDLLWSDPCPKPGAHPNTYRGGGTYFGPDVTKSVLERHSFNLLIRSHQCKPEGYEYCHDGRVLTIFSASNYYEVGSNKGAYAKISSKNQPRIVQFVASKKAGRKLTIKQRVKIVEDSAISSLKLKICGQKSNLMNEFIKRDTGCTGLLKLMEWCNIMQNTLQIDLPWRSICPKLASMRPDGMVEYKTIFEDLKMHNKFSGISKEHEGKEVIDNQEHSSVAEAVYRNKENLETIFRAMDRDNSGQICMAEFEDACHILSQHTGSVLSREHIVGMARNMDKNKDGYIDFAEFLEAFCIVDNLGKELLSRRQSEDTTDSEKRTRRLSKGHLYDQA